MFKDTWRPDENGAFRLRMGTHLCSPSLCLHSRVGWIPEQGALPETGCSAWLCFSPD